MSSFFIKRPIVAIVISILMVIIGGIMALTLPVAQFPNIAPPEIRLQANYPAQMGIPGERERDSGMMPNANPG
jgi:multidrug efflux pump subunit AcrB